MQLQPLPPKRGLVYDRNGVLLADNRPSYLLSIVARSASQTWRRRSLSWQALVPDFRQRPGRTSRKKLSPAPPLRGGAAAFPAHRGGARAPGGGQLSACPGVVVDAQLLRYYPHGELFSHALGYVGRISERETFELDETDYRGTHHVGKVGVEKYYEDTLHGDVGYQNVETNAHGRVLRVLEKHHPNPGADLTLHLDIRVQQAAYDALGDRRGAVVAIDPVTGGVLALVSTPGFDTNLFVNGISSKDYSALRDSLDVPLFNRAIQGQYPPGSTIKPLMGMAGLESGLVTPETTVPDPGWYRLPGDSHRYRDWVLRIRGTGHAPQVDLKMAIAESCDTYFYDLGRRLTIDRMHDYLAPYGLGDRTGVDTTNERRGVLPSTQWKRDALSQVWYPGETISASIGQGYMLATPMQLAVATSVLASRGERRIPRLVKAIDGNPVPAPILEPVGASADNWDSVYEGMLAVVHGERGTAKYLSKGIRYQMAGKTGTAQVIGIAQNAVYNEDEGRRASPTPRFVHRLCPRRGPDHRGGDNRRERRW